MTKKFIINHTNRLIEIATNIARENNIRRIPYPSNGFKKEKDYKKYLNNLLNFIDKPELYHLTKPNDFNSKFIN